MFLEGQLGNKSLLKGIVFVCFCFDVKGEGQRDTLWREYILYYTTLASLIQLGRY